jgi:hypothetical protein
VERQGLGGFDGVRETGVYSHELQVRDLFVGLNKRSEMESIQRAQPCCPGSRNSATNLAAAGDKWGFSVPHQPQIFRESCLELLHTD